MPHLPVQRGNVTHSNRQALSAILYVAAHGCKWRGLPARFGDWHTIYTRMNRWSKNGVLDRVFEQLQREQMMQQLLRRADRATWIARDRSIAVPARLVALIERRYDKTVAEALAFHESQSPFSPGKRKKRRRRRIGHTLALRLHDQKRTALRFLTDLEVPFTNNEAERSLRTMMLRQKISGGFRSGKGAETFAILRILITTARKHGWNIIEALISPSNQLIAAVKCA